MLKRLLIIFTCLMFVSLAIFVLRTYFVDWFMLASTRFEPEVMNGEQMLVCLYCDDFIVGDYVLFWDDKDSRYMMERVTSVSGDDGVLELTEGRLGSQFIDRSEIYGRKFR